MGAAWQGKPRQHDLVAKTGRYWRLTFYLVLAVLVLATTALLVFESRSAHLQSRELSRYAAGLTYQVEPGPSERILYPSDGPFDKRQGYAYLPLMLERLHQRDYQITEQARFSDALLAYSRRGLFPPFTEKSQSGLSISDCRGTPFYEFRYPQQGYADFASIAPLVVDSLLFIENRHLLDASQPLANPAVDWPRFAMAALSQLGKMLDVQDQSAGGSTLATQLEKYRHSPDGLTLSAGEKLRQMFSASVRAYQDGPQTLEARQRIVRDYLNSVPLSAAPGHGEVHGLSTVHRYLLPQADEATFAAFLRTQLPQEKLTDQRIARLYKEYGPGAYSLPDQGYIARVHPLELWLLGYLIDNPQASFSDAVAASIDERQEVYGWLLRTRHKSARDSRIRIMLEVEAFSDIHRRWQNLGYPFQHLVPSLATALGSSGDRPAALAELMGIIQNDGIRQPVLRIDELHFAAGTPYETRVERDIHGGKRVMQSEVAAALRNALSQVVEGGTARRLQGTFQLQDGQSLTLGGKTGTGDNRIESVGPGGRVISSRAMNRTATFVFFLGPRHYGTLTAFVPGRDAERFTFTSALPVQVLKGMAPILAPYLEPGSSTLCDTPMSAAQISRR